MTRPIRFDPAAKRELNEAAEFYDSEDLGLGGAFLDAAERAFEQIQAFPESSPISLAPVRAKVLSAIPGGNPTTSVEFAIAPGSLSDRHSRRSVGAPAARPPSATTPARSRPSSTRGSTTSA